METYTLPLQYIFLFFATFFLVSYLREQSRRRRIEKRYEPIINLENAVDILKREEQELLSKISKTRSSYAEKRNLLDQLEGEIAVYDERLSFAELGVYEPHFDFKDSETYRENILASRRLQREAVKNKHAVTCPTDWTVDNSRAKGRTMINRQVRLTLRAFNNECEAAIANVRWNNITAMEKRIENAAEQINKMNGSSHVEISRNYISLKLDELQLAHEYKEKKKVERDERAEAARLKREEQRLIRDAELAEAEEEKRRQTLLEAQTKAEVAVGSEKEEMQRRIQLLEQELELARIKNERAQSMAQMTRSGWVYIISNIGSFGEDIVKIGMTRRIEPDERVRELGDASVPFIFDTHALIYSDDAPTLEQELHKEFDNRRVNTSNRRKEFFKVGLGEVREAVEKLAPGIPFYTDREAQDYYETIARRQSEAEQLRSEIESKLPREI